MRPLRSITSFHRLRTPRMAKAGAGHLTFDLWVQKTAKQEHGFDTGKVTDPDEIMISVNFWGRYGQWDERPEDWRTYCNCVFETPGYPVPRPARGDQLNVLEAYSALTIFEPERPLSEHTLRTFDTRIRQFPEEQEQAGIDVP